MKDKKKSKWQLISFYKPSYRTYFRASLFLVNIWLVAFVTRGANAPRDQCLSFPSTKSLSIKGFLDFWILAAFNFCVFLFCQSSLEYHSTQICCQLALSQFYYEKVLMKQMVQKGKFLQETEVLALLQVRSILFSFDMNLFCFVFVPACMQLPFHPFFRNSMSALLYLYL